VKNKPVSYVVWHLSNNSVICVDGENMGARKHIKRTEAMEGKNSVLCGEAFGGTKCKEKHRQLTLKAIDIKST